MVPRVAPEEHALPGLRAHDVTGLRVREHERPLQDVEQLIGGEHRPEILGVAKRSARRKAEDDRVDQLGGDVDPVFDEARFFADRLVDKDLAVGAIIVNRATPDFGKPVGRRPRRIADASWITNVSYPLRITTAVPLFSRASSPRIETKTFSAEATRSFTDETAGSLDLKKFPTSASDFIISPQGTGIIDGDS